MKYPIGMQNFGEIRRGGYAYVDKAVLMYKLVSEGKYYFLSRSRRFGKSLFHSTLEAYCEGQKDLFEGLAVSELEKEWVKHPILHLDLNTEKSDTKEALARIEAKGYAQPFADDDCHLFKIGINFSTATRRIDDWNIVE